MKVEVFGKQFDCDQYKAVQMKKIKDRSLRELFDIFQKLLPDHPNENNVVLYFLHDKENGGVTLLWTCAHYECTDPQEISGLVYFLLDLQWQMGHMAEIHVDLLDGFWEKLIITVYNSPFKYPKRLSDIKNPMVDYGD